MLKKTIFIILAIFIAAGMQTAGFCQELSGKGGAFEDVGLGLRPLGMGGAYSALAKDENAPKWNPAMLQLVRDPSAGFTWTNQFNLVQYHYLSVAYPLGVNVGLKRDIGVGIYAITAGDQAYRETTIGFSCGINARHVKIPLENLRFGMTVKLLMTGFGNDEEGGEDRVTGDSFGFSIDLAAQWQVSPQLSFAVISRELLNSISWNSSVKGSYSEGLPRKVLIAAGYELERIVFGFEYQPGLYEDVSDRVTMGLEATLWKMLKPRVGFAQNFKATESNRWITAGLGLDFQTASFGPIKQIKFGYTHLFHDIDHSPRVGLVVGW